MAKSHREAKKRRRNRALMGAITILIMVGGGLGIFANNLGSTASDLPYGEYSFNQVQNYWMTELDGQELYFVYHPFEVESYNVSKESIDMLKNSEAIVVSNDPNSQFSDHVARVQESFAASVKGMTGKFVINAFSVETDYDVPKLTCENATYELPVIMFEEGSTEIVEEDNCLHLYSRSETDYTRLTERLLYGIAGIIE